MLDPSRNLSFKPWDCKAGTRVCSAHALTLAHEPKTEEDKFCGFRSQKVYTRSVVMEART